jgi:hypothetical protein
VPIVHVPDVSTFEGLHDLFSLLNIVELSNVLHFGTYVVPSLPAFERKEMIHGRLKAREIVQWVLQNYTFAGGDSIETFYWSYLAYQARALLNSKRFAESDDIYSANENFIADRVQLLVEKMFLVTDQFWSHWESYCDVQTFAWPSTKKYVVKVKDPDERVRGMSVVLLCSMWI